MTYLGIHISVGGAAIPFFPNFCDSSISDSTLMSKIIFTYPKMMIFNKISNQCDPYLQGMCENQS